MKKKGVEAVLQKGEDDCGEVVDYIDGQEITSIRTINSTYANGYVEVVVNGERCRMSVNAVIQMVNEFNFVVEKKRKYNHLIRAIFKGGDD